MGAPGTDKALVGIMRWSTRPEWQLRVAEVVEEHVGDVRDDYELSREDLEELLGDAYPPFLGSAFEDLLTRRFEPDGTNLVDDYLKRRGFEESVPVKACLRALQGSVMSVYEVVETTPGGHFTVRDLIRGGEPIRIEERLASTDLLRWDRMAARVLPIRGKAYVSAGVLRLSFDAAAAILATARRLTKRLDEIRELDDETTLADAPTVDAMLQGFTPVITQSWLRSSLDEVLDQVPDQTSEGDPVVFTKTRFSIAEAADPAMISARLDARPELVRDKADEDGWLWMVEVEGASRVAYTDDPAMAGKRLMGWLGFEDDDLVLSTLSVQRAERGAAWIADALGQLVGEPRVEAPWPEEPFEASDAPAPPSVQPDDQLSLFPEGDAASLQMELDRHYREALVTAMPVLGDRTPRQAVRSEEGRHQVAEWLKFLENQEARHVRESGGEPYDFSWMWEALKVVHLRR